MFSHAHRPHQFRVIDSLERVNQGVRARALYLALGRRIRCLREEHNLTQDELAAAAAVSRSSIANIERGQQQAPVHVLLNIALRLDLEIAGLLPTREEILARVEAGGSVPKLVSIAGEAEQMSGEVTLLVADLLRAAAGPAAAKRTTSAKRVQAAKQLAAAKPVHGKKAARKTVRAPRTPRGGA